MAPEGHPARPDPGGLSGLVETAHIARNQGNDTLYAWGNNGLMRAVEYIASYNLGNDVPYAPMQPFTLSFAAVSAAISGVGRGQFQPTTSCPSAAMPPAGRRAAVTAPGQE